MTREELLKDYKEAIAIGDTELEDAIGAKLEALDKQPAQDTGNQKDYSKLPIGNRFLLGVGNAVVEDALGLGQLVGMVDRSQIDAQREKFKSLQGDTAATVGGVTGKIADVMLPGGAAKNFGGYIPLVGKNISKLGEMVTTPSGFWNSVGGGAILGATQPVGEQDSRLVNAALGGAAGGAIPGALIGGQKVSQYVKDHLPTNSALNQIRDVFGDIPVPKEAQTIAQVADDTQHGPALPRYFGVEDVKPTVGMLTDSPELKQLEMNARLRNPGKFMAQDNANTAQVYSALEGKAMPDATAIRLQDALNASTTPLREDAFSAANANPGFADNLQQWIADTAQQPGVRNSNAMPVLNKAQRQAGVEDVQAQDLYTLRKELGETLNLKTVAPDELTNSAKSNRRLVSELMAEIDDSLNSASGGKFADYLAVHSEGMKPIEEGRAFQNILDKFETNAPIPGTGAKQVTPAALRKAVDAETYRNAGKQGYVSNISDQGRRTANDAIDVMNSIESAKKGVNATAGSQTAPYLTSLLNSAIPKSGMIGTGIDYLRQMGIRTGNGLLDDAMSDPALLQQLLNKYHVRPPVNTAPPGLLDYTFLPSTAGMAYIAQH